jgi:murein DD-endopeptidase MepM/ murein hydrolase activator NlpD
MSEQSNHRGPIHKLRNTRVNRATVIVSVILIAALAVIIGVTVAANRSKKNQLPLPNDTTQTTESTVGTETEPTPETEAQRPADTKPTDTPADTSASLESKLPTFVLPVNGVLSKKHDPELQVYSQTMNDYRVHIGVDIVTEKDAPVYAAADGTVARIWKDVLMGYCIAVQHSGDCLTVYKNLSEELPGGIAEGATVRSGQLIASVGESAMVEVAEEPHLHFEMTIEELSVDPLEYFNEHALASLSIDASFGE